ncbi:MAG: hypothetical protein ACRCUS_01905, partial [Anaerovoracaceae bacterium]
LLFKRKLWMLGIALAIALLIPISVNATTTVTMPISSEGLYYRYVTCEEERWTSNSYVAGQPSVGTYLKKGDFLFYTPSGGNTINISMSIGFSVGPVSVGVGMGKQAASGVGVGLKAPEKGYYKIKAKKYVFVTVKTTQSCGSKIVKGKVVPDGKWKNIFVIKKYSKIKNVPTLVKQ